jgi:glyoxylase-like metal-dependent hydrolase (beta-lactamase superfamily II)
MRLTRALLVPALAIGPLAQAQVQPDAAGIEVKAVQVASGFYVIDETAAHGGAVSILSGPDGMVLIDTGTAVLAGKVAAEVHRLSPQPVRYVVSTHAHVDEIGGNEIFARQGAVLVGRDVMRETMLHPKAVAAGADGRTARQARAPSAEGAPSVTFKNEMSLHLNGQEVRLVAMPRAHTDNDAIAVFPGLDIIATGDVLRAGEYPSINRPDGGSLPGMVEALDRLLALGGANTRYVTSHGQVVGRGAVAAQRTLLLTSRDRIAALIKEGKSLDQILAAKVTEGLGAQAQPGHISADAFVRDVYAELKT